jgi:hypothetical protein
MVANVIRIPLDLNFLMDQILICYCRSQIFEIYYISRNVDWELVSINIGKPVKGGRVEWHRVIITMLPCHFAILSFFIHMRWCVGLSHMCNFLCCAIFFSIEFSVLFLNSHDLKNPRYFFWNILYKEKHIYLYVLLPYFASYTFLVRL